MAVSAGAVYGAIAGTAGLILTGATREALQSGPDYLRDGQPEGTIRRAGLLLAREICLAYSQNPTIVGENPALGYEKICRPFLDSVGAGGGLKAKLPFRGGQCPVLYLAESFTTVDGVENGPFSQQTVVGPVTLLSTETFPTPGNPGFTTTRWTFLGGDGQQRILSFGAGGGPQNAVQTFKLRRADGLLDDCGNPAPDVEQPTPDPAPQPNPRPIIVAPDIDIDASININAAGIAIVNFGDGNIEINPFGGGGAGDDGGPAPGDLGEPGNPVDGEGGEEIDGEAPDGKVIGGLIINFRAQPVGAKEYSDGIFRGGCYVYIGNPAGLDLHPECSMLRDGQLILPEKDNLTRFSVVVNPGFSLRVTPLFREP